jgi:hypothetical protein
MMLEALAGTLEGGRRCCRGRSAAGWPRSEVAEILGETERAHPGCRIGSYPFFREGKGGANFVIRSPDEMALEACLIDLIARLEATGRTIVAEGI